MVPTRGGDASQRDFCNACHETSSSRADFQGHLRTKHSNSFNPAELQIIIEKCERPIASEQCCPLKNATEKLRRHLGGHLQLFVPKPREDEGTDEDASVGVEAGESEDDHGSRNGSKLDFESNPSRTSGSDWPDGHEQAHGGDLRSSTTIYGVNDMADTFQRHLSTLDTVKNMA